MPVWYRVAITDLEDCPNCIHHAYLDPVLMFTKKWSE